MNGFERRAIVFSVRLGRALILATCLGSFVGDSAKAQAKLDTYGGLCEASGGVAIGGGRFLVVDDESNDLYTFRVGDPTPDRQGAMNSYLGVDRRKADLEGTARIGDRVYVIGSHSNNDEGRLREDRHRLFYMRIPKEAGGALEPPPRAPFVKLLTVLASDPRFAAIDFARAAKLSPKEAGGLSIEGLAATPDGGLMIGFRNPPMPDGRAIVIELANPAAVLDDGAVPVLAGPYPVDLQGRGIRSMERVGNRYLIVAGAYGTPGAMPGASDFALFSWPGPKADAQKLPTPWPEPTDLTVEGMFASEDGRTLHFVSDDGKFLIGGKKCEDLPVAEQRFRMLSIPMPD